MSLPMTAKVLANLQQKMQPLFDKVNKVTADKPKTKKELLEATLKAGGEDAATNRAKQNSLKDKGSIISALALSKRASEFGFKCHNVPEDGNCFFHAVAHQLIIQKKLPANLAKIAGNKLHIKLRALAVEHIKKHISYYRSFSGAKNFEALINKISKIGVWADDLLCLALARDLQLTIVIVRGSGSDVTIIKQPNPKATVFLGYIVDKHYQSLIKNNVISNRNIADKIAAAPVDYGWQKVEKQLEMSARFNSAVAIFNKEDADNNKLKKTTYSKKEKSKIQLDRESTRFDLYSMSLKQSKIPTRFNLAEAVLNKKDANKDELKKAALKKKERKKSDCKPIDLDLLFDKTNFKKKKIKKPDKPINLDLHGMPFDKAKQALEEVMLDAKNKGINNITIITGRGNHPNPNGRRGRIYKALPYWLQKYPVVLVEKGVGSYIVSLTTDVRKNTKIEKVVIAERPKIKSGQLMSVIYGQVSFKEKCEKINEILYRNPNALNETSVDGTTALMVAASFDQVDMLEFLLERDQTYSLKPDLLKRTSRDGTNALMVALMKGHSNSVKYLTTKAPSLLKMKRFDGSSCIKIAADSKKAEEMLTILHKILEERKREKGYTGLFRESQALLKGKNVRNRKGILMSDSIALKEHRVKHNWFFTDRVELFLRKIRKHHEKINTAIKELRAFKDDEKKDYKIRYIFRAFIKKNHQLLRALLRFNQYNKLTSGRYYKHNLALKVPAPFKKIRAGTAPKNPNIQIKKSIINKKKRYEIFDSKGNPLEWSFSLFKNHQKKTNLKKQKRPSQDPSLLRTSKSKNSR